jgi:hypothetical protein
MRVRRRGRYPYRARPEVAKQGLVSLLEVAMFFITEDGVKLFYLDEGRGQPVLLLHAFPLNADSFRAQIASLSSR